MWKHSWEGTLCLRAPEAWPWSPESPHTWQQLSGMLLRSWLGECLLTKQKALCFRIRVVHIYSFTVTSKYTVIQRNAICSAISSLSACPVHAGTDVYRKACMWSARLWGSPQNATSALKLPWSVQISCNQFWCWNAHDNILPELKNVLKPEVILTKWILYYTITK